MTRLEMLLWSILTIALAWPMSAKADHYQPGPPIGEAYALSTQISRELSALEFDVRQNICDRHDRDRVLHEVRDVYRELDDLNRSLHDAARRPEKWDRICKRAEDVQKDLEDLDRDLHKAIDRMNRYRPREVAFVPVGPSQYRSNYRTSGQSGLSLSFNAGGGGRVTLSSNDPRRVPFSQPYRGPAEGYSPIPQGTEMLNHVHLMQALAREIHRLAH